MARPVHPSSHGAHDSHPSGKPENNRAGHSDPNHGKPGDPKDQPRDDHKGFGRRAADNVSDAVENWASRRSDRPHGSNGVGRAARNAIGTVTKGAQAASSPLHNQDPYHVASVTGEAMGAATSAFNLAKTHAGDLAASATNAAFKGRRAPKGGPTSQHAPHDKPATHSPGAGHPPAPQAHDGSKAVFGGAKPNRNADTTARDALGSAAAQTQHAAQTKPSPRAPQRDTGPEIE